MGFGIRPGNCGYGGEDADNGCVKGSREYGRKRMCLKASDGAYDGAMK
jgi:hypothetical protein